jgi:hypothetical protein
MQLSEELGTLQQHHRVNCSARQVAGGVVVGRGVPSGGAQRWCWDPALAQLKARPAAAPWEAREGRERPRRGRERPRRAARASLPLVSSRSGGQEMRSDLQQAQGVRQAPRDDGEGRQAEAATLGCPGLVRQARGRWADRDSWGPHWGVLSSWAGPACCQCCHRPLRKAVLGLISACNSNSRMQGAAYAPRRSPSPARAPQLAAGRCRRRSCRAGCHRAEPLLSQVVVFLLSSCTWQACAG